MGHKEAREITVDEFDDLRGDWVRWNAETDKKVVEKVEAFTPLDTNAGRAATDWLHQEAGSDIFTETHLLVSDDRLEGFISCRVSEATLTSSDAHRLGGNPRKVVRAFQVCWCAKHFDAHVDGDVLLFNALRLGREVRPECLVLAVDPRDAESREKVWQGKHGFRPSVGPTEPGKEPRLWLPLNAV